MLNLPMNFMLLASGHDPVDHAIPHHLHEEPLSTFEVGGEGYNNKLFEIFDGKYEFFVDNHMMMTAVSAIIVAIVFIWVARRVRPKGEGLAKYQTRGSVAQAFEALCVFIRDDVAKATLGAKMADKYIYYIWTIFFFILFSNIIGLIPIGYLLRLATNNPSFEHWGGTATSNLALNIVLALGSLVMIIGIGIREQGLKHFVGHFNPIGWEPKDLPIGIPLFFLEWMGLMIKCTVLAMRLFGTMMAGHLAIAAIVSIIFMAGAYSTGLGFVSSIGIVIGCVMLMLLELLICCLQAYIFTFLTVLFISLGAVGHDDHHHDVAHA